MTVRMVEIGSPPIRTAAGSILKAALAYAANGYPIFPCLPDKSPYVKGGFKAASCERSIIEVWWSKWPNAMIGMPTGNHPAKRNDVALIVLDIDRKNGKDGFVTLKELNLAINGPELFAISKTPSGGGRHAYFRLPPGTSTKCSQDLLGPGLDVRGDGGYVIVPPSRPLMDGPGYEWVQGHEFPAL